MKKMMICPNVNCEYQGKALRKAKGSILVGLVLMCFFFFPGLIYFALKSGYRYYCPKCGIQIAEN